MNIFYPIQFSNIINGRKLFFLCLNILIVNFTFAQGLTKNGKITTTGSEYVNKNGGIGGSFGVDKNGKVVAAIISKPTVTTTTVTSIKGSTVSSGGNVTSAGGLPITDRGVCWSTSANPTPTISDNVLSAGAGSTGAYTSNLTGLTQNTVYYLRAYATNSQGTAYGETFSFTTISIAIGDKMQGGTIFYILQPGDPGYDANVLHGLIAAPEEQDSAFWGCLNKSIGVGARSVELGAGKANTTAIMTGCAEIGIAAELCASLSITEDGNTYEDWYLPSQHELTKLVNNRASFGGLLYVRYFSSTESDTNFAWGFDFTVNKMSQLYKGSRFGVRAIRSF